MQSCPPLIELFKEKKARSERGHKDSVEDRVQNPKLQSSKQRGSCHPQRHPALQCLSSRWQRCSRCLSSASWHAHGCLHGGKTEQLSTQLILSILHYTTPHCEFLKNNFKVSLPPSFLCNSPLVKMFDLFFLVGFKAPSRVALR